MQTELIKEYSLIGNKSIYNILLKEPASIKEKGYLAITGI
jgi:hypothetical protein